MSKVLLGIVLGAFAFYAWQRVHAPAPEPEHVAAEETAADLALVEQPADTPRAESPEFRCDGRVHCRQMKSCEEANFFVENCSGVKMDGDGDGKPCEDWCGH